MLIGSSEQIVADLQARRDRWGISSYNERIALIRQAAGDERCAVQRPRPTEAYKRWVVERTFAWLGRDCRLAKEFEETTYERILRK